MMALGTHIMQRGVISHSGSYNKLSFVTKRKPISYESGVS